MAIRRKNNRLQIRRGLAAQLNELETNVDHTERTLDHERITDLQELILPITPIHNMRTARECEGQTEVTNFDIAVRDLSKFFKNLDRMLKKIRRAMMSFKMLLVQLTTDWFF